MPADLLTPPEFDQSWTVQDTYQLCFSSDVLKDGVTLSVGPADAAPIITEKDVKRVYSGYTRIDPTNGGEKRDVVGELTPDAVERLQAYTAAHIGDTLAVRFNGQAAQELENRRADQQLHRRRNSAAGSLEDFEQKYLTTTCQERRETVGPAVTVAMHEAGNRIHRDVSTP